MKTKKKWSAAIGVLLLVSVLFLGASRVQAGGHGKTTRLVMETTTTGFAWPEIVDPGTSWVWNGYEYLRGYTTYYEFLEGTFVTSDGNEGTFRMDGFSVTENQIMNLDTGEAIGWGTWTVELTLNLEYLGYSMSGSFEGRYISVSGPDWWNSHPYGHCTEDDLEGAYYRAIRVGENGEWVRDTMIIIDPHGRIGT